MTGVSALLQDKVLAGTCKERSSEGVPQHLRGSECDKNSIVDVRQGLNLFPFVILNNLQFLVNSISRVENPFVAVTKRGGRRRQSAKPQRSVSDLQDRVARCNGVGARLLGRPFVSSDWKDPFSWWY